MGGMSEASLALSSPGWVSNPSKSDEGVLLLPKQLGINKKMVVWLGRKSGWVGLGDWVYSCPLAIRGWNFLANAA